MDVKSEKTFEEIVERLSALFKLKPAPGERDYEEVIQSEPVAGADTPPILPEQPLDPQNTK